MLPDLEETFHEAAALARIWQDVDPREKKEAELTAVFYSSNGTPRAKLRPGEKLLADDKIHAVYAADLRGYYTEITGQTRLFSRRK